MSRSPRKPRRKTPADEPARPGTSVRRSGLAVLRRELEKIDLEIIEQINRRAVLAKELWELEQSSGKPASSPAPGVELSAFNPGPLSDAAVRSVMRDVESGSRALQAKTTVAFLGPEFTYSHLAAIHRFGKSVEMVPVTSIAAVFEEVHSGQAAFGLVPVENSTDGRVADTLDMFAKLPVKICGEVPLRIHHNLLGQGPRSAVRVVHSKTQPLSQCRNWIAKHLPDAATSDVASTTHAARLAQNDATAAAIASAEAATEYGLKILAKNIEDNPDNLTRFAVISQHDGERSGDDKTALLMEIAHRPGALADTMAIFKRSRLNMTWIESFPIPGHAGRYLFFIECEGHRLDLRVRRALASLEKKTVRLEVLGSYARSVPVG